MPNSHDAMFHNPLEGNAHDPAPIWSQEELSNLAKDIAEGKKIPMIKEIRGILNLGLMEAKQFVESIPKDVVVDEEKAKAEEIKKKLEAAGGVVEIK